MFCNQCGQQVTAGSKFCNFCGAKLLLSGSETVGNSPIGKNNTSFGKKESEEKNSSVNSNSVTCPKCGGTVKTEDGLDTFFCLFCGNKIVLSGMSDAAYGAKVRKMKIEQEERMQTEYLSHEKDMLNIKNEAESKEKKNALKLVIITLLVIFLFFGGLMLWTEYPSIKSNNALKSINDLNEDVEDLIDEEEYEEAEKVNKKIKKKVDKTKGQDWNDGISIYLENYYEIIRSQREDEGIGPDRVVLKADLEEIDDMSKEDVVDYLLKAGFVNITFVTRDADTLFSTKWGSVDEISINGADDCKAGEEFDDDVEVIVKVWCE